MCLTCWDAQFNKMYVKGCDGNLKPFMTLEDLRKKLVRKWIKTNQTDHAVYKDAVINPPGQHYVWQFHTKKGQEVHLTVDFV